MTELDIKEFEERFNDEIAKLAINDDVKTDREALLVEKTANAIYHAACRAAGIEVVKTKV